MFFIVNKTKNTIVISDINVTLGPRQAIDLDRIMDRSKSDGSKFLKAASRRGEIDIRIKDGGQTSKVDPPKVNNTLDDFKKEMMEEIRDLLAGQSQPIAPEGLNKKDLAEFAKQIIQNIPKQETVIIQGQSKDDSSDEDVAMNEEVLADMGARAVNNIVEGSDVQSIICKEEKQENTILDNISELEDMI